jgi:hypothetical protein
MKARAVCRIGAGLLLLWMIGGCQTTKPYDYTNFRAHPPRSILVLPPLNESTAVEGTYSYLSTVTQPLAELGYYVFPVDVVDQFLKENGMPTAGEMHQVPLAKAAEIFGADSVLFVTLKQYGSKYRVLSSTTTVSAEAKLVDTRTGMLLWQGAGLAQQGSSGSGNVVADLVAAAVTQAISSTSDPGHQVCRLANQIMFNKKDAGLPVGPYSPKYGRAP